MDSLCLFLGILHFWRGGRLPLSSSSPKSSRRPCLWFGSILNRQRFSQIRDTPSYIHLLTQCPIAGEPLLGSLDIARLFLDSIACLAIWAVCSSDNFMYRPREGRSIALESGTKIAETFLLSLSIACGLTVPHRRRLGSGRDLDWTEITSTGPWSQANPVLQWNSMQEKI